MRRLMFYMVVIPTLIAIVGRPETASAQQCDEACFIINNTFVPETLKRYIVEFPNGRYVDVAAKRLEFLNRVVSNSSSAFGSAHVVGVSKLPSSGMPQKPLN